MAANGDIVFHPNVMWAQRKDVLYVTICIGDLKDTKIDFTEDQLSFSATCKTDNKKYVVTLDFYAPIVPSQTKQLSTDREVVFLLRKKTKADETNSSDSTTKTSTRSPVSGYWPQLLVQKKYHWLKTDFNRWKDEDEDDGEFDDDMFGGGNQDLSSMMQQMGGNDFNPSGTGDLDDADLEEGTQEPDSDDEELPNLE